jgi:hypothetical protein
MLPICKGIKHCFIRYLYNEALTSFARHPRCLVRHSNVAYEHPIKASCEGPFFATVEDLQPIKLMLECQDSVLADSWARQPIIHGPWKGPYVPRRVPIVIAMFGTERG